jgi:predicted Na+-dependent transporter
MWTTESLWFEIAIVSIIFAIGNMIFGNFEERTPRLRKVGKYMLTLIIMIAISFYFGRAVAMITFGVFFLPVLYIHIFYLPKKGINGWTGEPKSKYYEFRGWDKDIFKEK